jgi:hypothetical protein
VRDYTISQVDRHLEVLFRHPESPSFPVYAPPSWPNSLLLKPENGGQGEGRGFNCILLKFSVMTSQKYVHLINARTIPLLARKKERMLVGVGEDAHSCPQLSPCFAIYTIISC